MIFNKKFFIITAHPDDLEVGCGGLVQKIKDNGGSATNLIMVKPSAEHNTNRNKEIVKNEFEESKRILGFDSVIYDTPLHDNGRPNLAISNNIVSFVESVAQGHNILVSHWREDYHQDHRVCFDIAMSVSRKNFEQFWCMDHTPYNLHYKNYSCKYRENKIKSLQAYSSYFNNQSIETIINYNKYRGSFLGDNKLAETFNVIYNKDT